VGGETNVGRPVEDSFGLVETGGLPGIRITRNGQPIGRTDENGRIFLSRLSSLHVNEVAIDDKDIPIAYTVDRLVSLVSPGYRQGALIRFDVSRFHAVAGKVLVRTAAGERPGEYLELRLKAGEREVAVPTGATGSSTSRTCRPTPISRHSRTRRKMESARSPSRSPRRSSLIWVRFTARCGSLIAALVIALAAVPAAGGHLLRDRLGSAIHLL